MNSVLDWRGPEWTSGLLALVVHALFFLVLLFGLSWRVEKPTPPVQAQLWMSLPPVAGSVPVQPRAAPVMPAPPPRAAQPAPPPAPARRAPATLASRARRAAAWAQIPPPAAATSTTAPAQAAWASPRARTG